MGFWQWLQARCGKSPAALDEFERARRLVLAVERGGIPLNPARVNALARDLGLEVRRDAPVEETVARLRAALVRAGRLPG